MKEPSSTERPEMPDKPKCRHEWELIKRYAITNPQIDLSTWEVNSKVWQAQGIPLSVPMETYECRLCGAIEKRQP